MGLGEETDDEYQLRQQKKRASLMAVSSRRP